MKSPTPKEESLISFSPRDVTAVNFDERTLFTAGYRKTEENHLSTL